MRMFPKKLMHDPETQPIYGMWSSIDLGVEVYRDPIKL